MRRTFETRKVGMGYVVCFLLLLSQWVTGYRAIAEVPETNLGAVGTNAKPLAWHSVIPAGFSKIYLGEERETVLQARQGRLNPLIQEEGETPKVFVEKGLDGEYFDTVVFGFGDQTARLEYLMFLSRPAKGTRKPIDLSSFKQKLLSTLGWPGEILADDYQGQKVANLVWKNDHTFVVSTYSADSDTRTPVAILRILAGKKQVEQLLARDRVKPQRVVIEAIRRDLQQLQAIERN